MTKAISNIVDKRKALLTGIVFVVLLSIWMTGCASSDAERGIDMFAFDVPNDYSISVDSERECTIFNSESTAVGGIIATNLDIMDIKKDADGNALMQCLNKVHEGCEYFSWIAEDEQKTVQYVREYVNKDNPEESKEYYRVFFNDNSHVYDMWFDTDLIDESSISEFTSTVVG